MFQALSQLEFGLKGHQSSKLTALQNGDEQYDTLETPYPNSTKIFTVDSNNNNNNNNFIKFEK